MRAASSSAQPPGTETRLLAVYWSSARTGQHVLRPIQRCATMNQSSLPSGVVHQCRVAIKIVSGLIKLGKRFWLDLVPIGVEGGVAIVFGVVTHAEGELSFDEQRGHTGEQHTYPALRGPSFCTPAGRAHRAAHDDQRALGNPRTSPATPTSPICAQLVPHGLCSHSHCAPRGGAGEHK